MPLRLVPAAIGDSCEVSAHQLRAGRKRLLATVEQAHPEVVAICGAVDFGLAYGRKEWVVPGRQDQRIGEAQLWVLPNPSGSNPHVSIRDLATAFRSAALAAGVVS